MCLHNCKKTVEAESECNLDLMSIVDNDLIQDLNEKCCVSDACDVTKAGDLNILHLNIRSLQKNLDCLKELIDTLSKKDVTLDVILLCETWTHDLNSSLLDIEGYTLFLQNRKEGRGGGVGVYVKNYLNPKIKSDLSVQYDGLFESMIVEITTHGKQFFVSEFYRVLGTPEKPFEECISKLLKNCKNTDTFIGSDQNLDLLKLNKHKMTDKFLNNILENGLMPTILKPMRVTHTSSTLIDNIYVPINHVNSFKSHVLVDLMSDHFPCLVQICLNLNSKRSPMKIKSRKVNESALHNMNNDLLHKNWIEEFAKCKDLNSRYEKFVDTVYRSLDTHAPIKEKCISPRNIIHTPWMTPELLKNTKKCKHLYKESQKDPTSKNKLARYKNYAKTLRALKKNAKSTYFKNEILSYGGNCKKIWTLLNKLLGKHNDKTSAISELKVSGVVINDPLKICSALNNHFATAGEKVSKDPGTTKYLKYLGERVTSEFGFETVSENLVMKLVDQLPNKKSCGVDGINNILLKKIKYSIRLPLCILVNESLKTGLFPDAMKIAKVVALFKKGDTLLADNYRPISLLSVISKILERVVNNQLYNYLNEHNILVETQYGFRKKHSTTNAVQHLTGEILSGFEKKFSTLSVFIDLRKCFDSCRHNIILDKLEHYGVRGTALSWFQSYLSNRSQFVQFSNDIKSNPSKVNIGTPQGSILGPILTLIMLNDLNKSLRLSKSILFADDTTLYLQGANVEFLFIKMQRELNFVHEWLSHNGLSLNTSKTKCLLFHPKGTTYLNERSLYIDGKEIEQVECFKLLGVTLDHHLTFQDHVLELNHKLNQFKFLVRKLSKFLPIHCLRNIYFAFVHSRLTYGIGCWGSLIEDRLLQLLERQQQCFIRIINKKCPRTESSPLFLCNKVLKLRDVIILEMILFMFHYKSSKLPKPLTSMLVPKTHGYKTRNQSTPSVVSHKNSLFNKSFLNLSVQTWERYKHLFDDQVSTKNGVKKAFKYHCFADY